MAVTTLPVWWFRAKELLFLASTTVGGLPMIGYCAKVQETSSEVYLFLYPHHPLIFIYPVMTGAKW